MKLTDRQLEMLDHVFGAAYDELQKDYQNASSNFSRNAIEQNRKEIADLYEFIVGDDI